MKTSVKWVYFGAAAMMCTSLWIRPRTERSGVTAAVEPVITGAGTNRLARRVGDRLILEADMNYVARANEALSLTDPLQRPMQFCPLFREWVEADPESALAYLRQMPRGNEYGEGVGLMLGRVQLSDPERAVSLAAELVTRHEEMHLYNQLFSALAESNPSTAVRLVDGVPEGTAHRNAIRALASTWSQTDMESAFNWAINLPQASDSQMAAESVLLILAAKDPTLATDRARQYLRGEALQAVVEQATTRLIAKSSHRAPD